MGNFLAFIDGATAPRKNGVNRACGHFVGLLCFSKLFLGASSGSRSALREGKFAGPGSLEFVAVRRTGRLHIYNVGGPFGRSHVVNMQLICSAHGALYICSESGWRPSAGHPRATSKLQNSFSKKLLNLKPFFWARFALTRGGHGTL